MILRNDHERKKDTWDEKERDWLIVIYGVSTLLGYLMPNPVYTFKLNKYDL